MPSKRGPRIASRAGQALIEYVLMLSFIAVGLGGILAVLRDTAGSVYNNASSQVAIVCPYGVTNGGSGQNSNGSGGNCNGSGGAGGLINGVAGGGGVGGGSAGNPIGGTKGGGKP